MSFVEKVFEGTRLLEKMKSWRGSRRLVLFIVFVALLLDNMLLTTVVPIIPNFLHQLDVQSKSDKSMKFRSERIKEVKWTGEGQLAIRAHLGEEFIQPAILSSIEATQLPTNESEMAILLGSTSKTTPTSRTKTPARKSRRKPFHHHPHHHHRRPRERTTQTSPNGSETDASTREENVAVGLMFASKAVVQLLVNPLVGPMTNKIGYSIPMFAGFVIMFVSTLTFAFGTSYLVLFVARSVQGVGSACSSVSGMGMLASLYPDDKERGDAMAVALSGLAFGVLIGPPFGGVMYQFFGKESPFLILAALTLADGLLQLIVLQPAVQEEKEVGSSLKALLSDPYILIAAASITFGNMGIAILEPTLPLHMVEVMKAEKWEQGVAFLPCSVAYLLGTNLFGPLGHRFGRWLSAMVGMIVIGICLFIIPMATSTGQLILPNFGLGFSIGMVDSSMLPIMGHLVDLRHVPVYGSVYAITDVAFCLGFAVGPALSGSILNALGFKWMLWIMAIVDLIYAPLLGFLKNPPSKSEKQSLVLTNNNPVQNAHFVSYNSRIYDKFNNDEDDDEEEEEEEEEEREKEKKEVAPAKIIEDFKSKHVKSTDSAFVNR